MAKNTTFEGMPKPYGKSGHYYEQRRHELQGRGIKTGNLANGMALPKKEPFLDLGMLPDDAHKVLEEDELKLLKNDDKVIGDDETSLSWEIEEATSPVEPEEAGAEEIEIEGDEVEIKKPTKGFLKELTEGWNLERDVKGRKIQRFAKKELGEDVDLDEFESPEFASRGGKFGKMLADLFGDYRSEDFNELSDSQLEELAVKFDSQSGGLFGKPSNPFLEEMKKRIKSREKIKYEKAKLDAELEPSRIRVKKEIADIRKRAEDQSRGEGDIMERLLGF